MVSHARNQGICKGCTVLDGAVVVPNEKTHWDMVITFLIHLVHNRHAILDNAIVVVAKEAAGGF